ncbi:MAG: molybdopterin-dependent oxidoreductase [Burkholderiales bacterium]|nr:molybdopterin-dependent oxidoreductase [Burkholderiales bacterium]
MTSGRFQQLAHWGAYTAVVENGRLAACEPFARDPAPSPMLAAIPAMVHSPLRVQRPAVRTGWLARRATGGRGADGYVEVSWDRALSLVAEELARVRAERGPEAIFGGSYGWSSAGRFHHARTQVRRFLFSGGGCTDAVGNYSWGAAQFLLPHVIGTHEPVSGRVTDWNSVIGSTRLVIAFGGLALKNGQVTSGGAGAHTMEAWLRRARAAGIAFVVISPDRADTPAFLEAQWLAPRPNTDTALLLGMAHTLLAEGLHARAFLDSHCSGFPTLARYLAGTDDGRPKDADWAAAICGIDAATIRALARQAAATRTLLTMAWALQRAHRGEQPYWALVALAAMLGQIGLPGGGFAFGHGSMNGVGNPRRDVPSPEFPSGPNPAGRAVPVARLTDMLERPGAAFDFNGRRDTYPDIDLVYWAGGNPFHHHQDLNRLVRAWDKPSTIVVHESWWTPAARRADIVLPATTPLERDDIGGSSRDAYLFAMQRAIAPVGAARDDVDIFRELAARAGHEDAFTAGRDTPGWLRELWRRVVEGAGAAGADLPDYDAFVARGWVELPAPARDHVMFEAFRADPAAHPLRTPSGRIELASATIAAFGYADCPPHPAWLAPAEWLGDAAARAFPLHLVTVQPRDRLHSQMDPGPLSQAGKVAGRERLRIHPDDARARGLADGALARVFNRRGACLAGVAVDAAVRPGVVVMATGAWYDPGPDGLERGGNPNVLSLDVGTSSLTQGPSALSVLVEVERWNGAAPAVEAYRPPPLAREDAVPPPARQDDGAPPR